MMKIPIKPISLNNMYATGRNGRRFLTSEGRKFKEEFAYQLQLGTIINKHIKSVPSALSAVVEIIFTFKDKRKRDVDNHIKAVFDACTGILWEDDSQVVAVYAEKRIGTEESIEIQVETPTDCKSCGHYFVQ